MELSIVPITVIVIVALFFLAFGGLYILPARRVVASLSGSVLQIRKLDANQSKDKYAIESALSGYLRLVEIWKKYAETLHPQFEIQDGERKLICLRATVPAESFFSKDALVDTPLHTDFFKHLPGILTGVGIIGTFLGLIIGLQHFNVDTDAEKLQSNLALLLHGVWEAFIASGVAIFAAIFITLLEKFFLNLCYRKADDLVQVIDTLYEAGAGEEYLSRLVDSAEESAAQTRLLKDALVTDLKELLTNFSSSLSAAIERNTHAQTQALIESQQADQERLRESLAEAVRGGLEAPMQSIVEVSRTLGGNQGDAINDLLSALISRIEDTFGGQMRGLNDMMSGNASLMQDLQQHFAAFLDRLDQAGQSSQASQDEHLRALMDQAEQRQQRMNEQVNLALIQLSTTVGQLMQGLTEQHTALGQAGQHGLEALQEGLAAITEELRNTASRTAETFGAELQQLFAETEQRQGELGEQVRQWVERMQQSQSTQEEQLRSQFNRAMEQITGTVDRMEQRREQQDYARAAADTERAKKLDTEMTNRFRELGDYAHRLTQSVDILSRGLSQTVTRMERISIEGAVALKSSAEAIRGTIEGLEVAGKQVGQVLNQAATVQERLALTSQSLAQTSQALATGMADYQQHREQTQSLIDTLRGLAEDTERRAGLSRSLVEDMQDLVGHTRQLQAEANQFLAQAGDVLKFGFNSFADAVTTNMERSRAEFDKGLGQAVEMISGQIQELDEAFDKLIRAAGKHGE